MIICIEGIDASGKDTQAEMLAKKIRASLFHFPADDEHLGPTIRRHLRGEWFAAHRLASAGGEPYEEPMLNATVRQALMLCNRLGRTKELLAARKEGSVVLNRYTPSALVYGLLDGCDRAWLEATNAALPVQPDVCILIDIPVEESFKRKPKREDQYEASRTFLEKVRTGYVDLFFEQEKRRLALRNDPSRSAPRLNVGPRWVIIDGMQSVEAVHHAILEAASAHY